MTKPTITPPIPLIPESRARAVRVKAFATAEHLLDVVDSQVSKLQEITAADLPLAELLEKQGAAGLQRAMEQIPAMLEMAKEAANPLTKLVGILRSEAPIPGEPKAFGGSGVEDPTDPETIAQEDLAIVLRLHESPSEKRREPKKKPKRRKTKAG